MTLHRQRLKAVLIGLTLVLLAFCVCILTESRRSDLKAFIKHGEAILPQVMAQQHFYRDLTPSPDGKILWYIGCTAKGRRLFSLNLSNQIETIHCPTQEIGRLYGWSDDGTKLALTMLSERMQQRDYRQGVEWPQQEKLAIFEPIADKCAAFDGTVKMIDADASWLDNHSIIFTRYACSNDVKGEFRADLAANILEPFPAPPIAPVVVDSNRVVYCDGLNLFSVTLSPAKANRLTNFRKGDYDSPRWLRYQAKTNSFLFCARPRDGDSRYLYEIPAGTNRAVQLNQTDTYNGQWLNQGDGYALVGNISNLFRLEIYPRDFPAVQLFTNGGVISYCASPYSPKVFAYGAESNEPPAIWVYEYTNRSLKKLTNLGHGLPPAEVLERRVAAPDGLIIPFFVAVPPAKTQAKSPAIIFIPPPSGQFKKMWELESQFLAQVGFYYAAVNYRGCDGYGRGYSAGGDTHAAAMDVLEAYKALIAMPEIDQKRIYLAAQSGGTTIAIELMKDEAKRWRGVIFQEAGINASDIAPKDCPPILFCTGEHDHAANQMANVAQALAKERISAKLAILKDAGHTLQYYPEAWFDQERQILNFLAENENR